MEPELKDCHDILSPLATLNWTHDCCDWPGGLSLSQVVLLHNKIYFGATIRERNEPGHVRLFNNIGKVYSSNTDFTSWISLPSPGVTRFALCNYQSQLVLAGGLDDSSRIVKDLWVSSDGTNWQQSESLPPMPTACRGPALVNTGSPEYLIVAGGHAENFRSLSAVSVLIEKQWFSLQPLPIPGRFIKFTFHNGNLCLMGTVRGVSRFACASYCKLDSLIAACASAKRGTSDKEGALWKTLSMRRQKLFPISFGQQLVAIRRSTVVLGTTELHAYSPFTQSWIHVGDFPKSIRPLSTFVIPSGELIVICRNFRPIKKYSVLKATLRVPPYDPDSQFSVSALSRLEATGIEVITSLAKVYKQLLTATGITLAGSQQLLRARESGDGVKVVVHRWLSGESPRPATWRSLHEILTELDLEELSQQIEECLTSVNSLKELSTSVIMSALLQQRSLEPDQLPVKLPDYVPPTVKRYLTQSFQAITHQLPPPAISSCTELRTTTTSTHQITQKTV